MPANKITRSGYGVELKVQVDYGTSPNWETLPNPIYSGAEVLSYRANPPLLYGSNSINRFKNTKVFANLPNGQRIELVRTRNNRDSATFELPEMTYNPDSIDET